MKAPSKKLSILTIVTWIVGFILSFYVPPTSPFIWLPDTLLLLGFWPLFFAMRMRFFWLVFGVCNMFIGFVLYVAVFFPEKALEPYHMEAMKAHMNLYHPYWAWFLVGLVSSIVGLAICTSSLSIWLFRKIKNRQKTDSTSVD